MIRKTILVTLIAFFSLFVYPGELSAQDDAMPIETTQLPIGEEQDPNRPVEEEDEDGEAISPEDTTQTFLNGVLAGGAISLVVGFALGWFIKNKSYKE